MERWATDGKFDLAGPFRQWLALLGQESVTPRKRDTVFYETAPPLFIAATLLAAMVLPFGQGSPALDLATGALFINAALAYIMVSVLMAGWAPNGIYSIVGGWSFLGQLIAYSMPIVMAITATVMRAESMALPKIVASQQSLWNIIYQPVGFVLFYLSAMAMAFLPPFDLPTAPGTLAGGVWAEFTGERRLVFRIGRLALLMTLSLATTVLFLGGWHGPWLPDYLWTFLKTLAVAASFFGVSRFAVRIRYDSLLEWSWKYATPAALLNILWVGILLLL
uniref:NADH-quinone oxidoreductase subunit H n=1 Tax=Roseihalotalea indica TaxID=2867963 RepID=A0AA49JKI0_9BACT|nr:NADH-quinone oxidoreductase subunit H [Tunicatimonas sp. TK19036]